MSIKPHITKSAIKKGIGRAVRSIYAQRGNIIYYLGVVLALCAFAFGAERIRGAKIEAVEENMPAVEIKTAVAEEPISLMWPEEYQITRRYSALPEWNRGFGCWETHPAVDVASGDLRVRCVSAGRVRAMGKDGVSGGYVEVEGDAGVLRYCSIEPDVEIEIGSNVNCGDLLGLMADNMPSERNVGAHLHLEMLQNNARVDVLAQVENQN